MVRVMYPSAHAATAAPVSLFCAFWPGFPFVIMFVRFGRVYLMQKFVFVMILFPARACGLSLNARYMCLPICVARYLASIESAPAGGWQSLLYISDDY